MKKVRLDDELVNRGFAESKEKAQRLIMAGQVIVADSRIDKVGTLIKASEMIRIKGKNNPYVSRAGNKLAGALEAWPQVSIEGKVALDLGASTGGFTDCLLQKGATKVYAVDVGTNQLVWQLRNDPRVCSLEKTHAKMLNTSLVPEPIDLVTVDVSFTSLRYVLPFTFPLLSENAILLCLVKPQFEVERHLVGPGGIVAETEGEKVLTAFLQWVEAQELQCHAQMKSPVKGRDGNQEYFVLLAN